MGWEPHEVVAAITVGHLLGFSRGNNLGSILTLRTIALMSDEQVKNLESMILHNKQMQFQSEGVESDFVQRLNVILWVRDPSNHFKVVREVFL